MGRSVNRFSSRRRRKQPGFAAVAASRLALQGYCDPPYRSVAIDVLWCTALHTQGRGRFPGLARHGRTYEAYVTPRELRHSVAYSSAGGPPRSRLACGLIWIKANERARCFPSIASNHPHLCRVLFLFDPSSTEISEASYRRRIPRPEHEGARQ